MMHWTHCKSSNVHAVAVDGGDLCVVYVKALETVYRYQGAARVADSEAFDAAINGETSIGQFINSSVKPHYGFIREVFGPC